MKPSLLCESCSRQLRNLTPMQSLTCRHLSVHKGVTVTRFRNGNLCYTFKTPIEGKTPPMTLRGVRHRQHAPYH